MKRIDIENIKMANNLPFVLIAGPCVIENEKHCMLIAEKLYSICNSLNLNFIFKSSFDKANRSSIKSHRGVNIKNAINIFNKIKKNFGCPIITDVHNENQCIQLANEDCINIIQIPAFLCRQTDLLLAAGNTKKIINVKKGQFLSPHDVKNIFTKIESTTNDKIIITERGTSFGYNNLVSDFRSIDIMKKFLYPVVFDATHSVQEPGGLGHASGGKREFVSSLAKASISIGVAGLFIETHDDPDNAPSDGPNMLNINDLKDLLIKLIEIDKIVKS
ncbi:MAG: 3-deoxy-8-phosphooctulonate synthase [Pelagibacteraceae bacterium]|nr:3-deoxy-8-phosphooctulonate synthase [Pelagibacteraceae bacterium]